MSNRRKPTQTIPLDGGERVLRTTVPSGQAFWNGLPTTAVRGTAVVADAPEHPQYWAKHEGLVGRRIEVVMVNLEGVNAGGGVTILDDRDGSGWWKVTEGYGSPSYAHRGVAVEPGSFELAS